MRPSLIALAAAVALTGAGLFLTVSANRPDVNQVPIISNQPRHPVTPAMTEDAARRARKDAPDFEKKDYEGKAVEIGRPHPGKLQFAYFVLEGCPCSIEVEPLFHELWKVHRKNVDFVAVINKDDKVARQWSVDMLTPYPVVADPKGEVITAYDAPNSAYSALIDDKGRIIKVWPGYSSSILLEMNKLMAEEMGQKPTKFDPQYAPKEATSGCAFDFKPQIISG
ncbi:redoxin domain-containing protein [bacterium]|nr:MAG: redoxin domain-containing protein [bacterium]